MIKRNKIKILIATLITAITTCLFLITSHAQEGYEINNNGNINSLNLLNNDWQQGEIRIDSTINPAPTLCYHTLELNSGTYTIKINNRVNNGNLLIHNLTTQTTLVNWQYNATFTINNNARIGINYAHEGASIVVTPNEVKTYNIMLNEGNVALDYFPYGTYWSQENANTFNSLIGNIADIYINPWPTIGGQGEQEINKELATQYLSPTYWDFVGLYNALNINYAQGGQGRTNFYIEFIKPINFSNFTFYLGLSGDAPDYETENYYISFNAVRGYNGKYQTLNRQSSENIIEMPNNALIQSIDIFYYTSEQYRNWPETMTTSEYRVGYEEGFQNGMTTGKNVGYNNGYNEGINEGKIQGINQANSQINTNSASYIEGYTRGEQSQNNLGGLVITIMESPINMFRQMFNFDILGFNISNFIFSLVSLLLIAYIIKKLIK